MPFFHYLMLGFKDIRQALESSPKWLYLGIVDIQLRYRRSIIGPWWVTISTGIMVGSLGFLWSKIFGSDVEGYMPFFAIGYVFWGWMSSQILDASLGFSQFESTIRQINLPFHIYILRLLVRPALILLHNLVIVLVVLLFVGRGVPLSSLISIPAIILVQLTVFFLSVTVAIFCTRFQDMVQVVASLIQIVFFMSPILWEPGALKGKAYVAELNPIYHWLEIIRVPLLGGAPSLASWLWSIGSLLVAALLSFYFLGRYRTRIAYWV